jgi:N-acetylneuraminic acid mutarotase
MEVFNTQTGLWSVLASMPSPRLFAAAVISGKYIYSMGGIDNSGQYSDVVEKYDLELNQWSEGTPLTSPRCRFAAVTHDEKIFVLGGLGGENDRSYVNLNLVEYYETEQNRWTIAQSMSIAKHGHAAIINNDHILVAGGYTDSGVTGGVDQYHFTTQTWMSLQDMPTPRGFFGIANINQKIYTIGGRVKEIFAPVERYQPEKNKWTSMSPIEIWRNRFGMTSIGNTIYIMGGEEQPKSFVIGKLRHK